LKKLCNSFLLLKNKLNIGFETCKGTIISDTLFTTQYMAHLQGHLMVRRSKVDYF